ncbi:MAG: SDR family oxidoreductase [Rhodospirillaceae bacterium]|nr:SDR family oxidoreductase [Rhodospirillaceae bacterium]
MSKSETDAEKQASYAGLGRLKDRVVVIFGAGSVGPGWGNGKATAVAYAREGAKVIAVDYNRAAAEETATIIRGEGLVCEALVADVTKSDQVKKVIDDTMALFGRIDVLQNNVGATVMGGPVELSEADWQKQMDINLKSVFLTCKHTLPVMLAQGSGAIVNVSSLAALRYTGYPYIGYYAAKAGVNQFTVGLALQYAGQGIRVNAVVPGLMNTPLIFQQISGQYADKDAMVKARDAACPMGRMGTGWDVARASVFLASDEAQYITGVCLPVDGGLHCRSM